VLKLGVIDLCLTLTYFITSTSTTKSSPRNLDLTGCDGGYHGSCLTSGVTAAQTSTTRSRCLAGIASLGAFGPASGRRRNSGLFKPQNMEGG
jgi:hypothetical protein